jgi:uncharacterized protein YndB with AHSA1/START domain
MELLAFPIFKPIIIETMLTVSVHIAEPAATAWQVFTTPQHIMQWNFAADTWHCPAATNTLEVGGPFSYTMAAKDGSFAFDLQGVFTKVEPPTCLHYSLADGRKVTVDFTEEAGGTTVTQSFEPENQNPLEMQQAGWQAILQEFARRTLQVANNKG